MSRGRGRPKADDEDTVTENRQGDNADIVDTATRINVRRGGIVARNPILQEMAESSEIKIVGGMHELSTGAVTCPISGAPTMAQCHAGQPSCFREGEAPRSELPGSS